MNTFMVVVLFCAGVCFSQKTSPPRFNDKLLDEVNIQSKPGENVKLICKISGRPRVKTTWQKDGVNIRKSKKYYISRQFLMIKKITEDEVGEYNCEGQNSIGKVSRKFKVSFTDTLANTINVPAEMEKMKKEIEQLKEHIKSIPKNVLNIHFDNEDDYHANRNRSGGQHDKPSLRSNESITSTEHHIYMHLHVDKDAHNHSHHHKDEDVHDYHHKGDRDHDNRNKDDHDHDYYHTDDDDELHADCEISSNKNIENGDIIKGTIHFKQKDDGPVEVFVQLSGFDMTKKNAQHVHGFHIHTYGDLTNSCDSLGPHYNPDEHNHGSKDATKRHAGDLGNIECDMNGQVSKFMNDNNISLQGRHSIIGRSVIIHQGPDDLGLAGDAGSMSSGNAGARIACCVIGIADPYKYQRRTGQSDINSESEETP